MSSHCVMETPWPARRRAMIEGAQAIAPLVLGAIPFGLIFGALAATGPLGVAGGAMMSALVFAGSAQFIALGLIAAHVGVGLIVLTTLVVNLRHLLYAAALLPHVRSLSQRWKLTLGFTLVDEVFAVVIARYQRRAGDRMNPWFHAGAALTMYVNWQLCTWAGLALGRAIPDAASWGLDFAMVATFIGMIVAYTRERPMLVAAVSAGIASVIAHDLPHQAGLMVGALIGVGAGIVMHHGRGRRR